MNAHNKKRHDAMGVAGGMMTMRAPRSASLEGRPAAVGAGSADAHPFLRNKRLMILGGTGSLGQALLAYLQEHNEITVFSRDEEKQWRTKNRYPSERLKCIIGDIRDRDSLLSALQSRRPEVIINAAALKQITTCEYFPSQAIETNVVGVQRLVDAVNRTSGVEAVIGISTDKACQPVNVYGMSKAIQERIYIEANLHARGTRFLCVRYGNVLESRGSVIPLFKEQIAKGGPITITVPQMTRFLLSLRQSVELIMAAYCFGLPGDVWIPKVSSATVADIAQVLLQGRHVPITTIGIRPGEKIHETLVSEEEVFRTIEFQGYYVIEPVLPELRAQHVHQRHGAVSPVRFQRYASTDNVLSQEALREFLATQQVI